MKIIEEREKERLGQWMDGRIRCTKYNAKYKDIRVIKRLKPKVDCKLEMWEKEKNKYWPKGERTTDERRRCQIRKETKRSIVHILTYVKLESRIRDVSERYVG